MQSCINFLANLSGPNCNVHDGHNQDLAQSSLVGSRWSQCNTNAAEKGPGGGGDSDWGVQIQ